MVFGCSLFVVRCWIFRFSLYLFSWKFLVGYWIFRFSSFIFYFNLGNSLLVIGYSNFLYICSVGSFFLVIGYSDFLSTLEVPCSLLDIQFSLDLFSWTFLVGYWIFRFSSFMFTSTLGVPCWILVIQISCFYICISHKRAILKISFFSLNSWLENFYGNVLISQVYNIDICFNLHLPRVYLRCTFHTVHLHKRVSI